MRYIYNGNLKDGNGRVLSNATVNVYLAGGTTPANIYTASSGGVAVNSVTTDSDGDFYFYVDEADYNPDQRFKVVTSKVNYISNTYDDIVIFPFKENTYYANAGAADQGVDSDDNSIADLMVEIGEADERTIVLRPGVYTYSTDDTITSNITLDVRPGALISVDSGVTLTINKQPKLGLYQVFTGDGSVVFGSGAVTEVYPEWWGAVGDGTTDDTDAIASAIAASAGKILKFGPKTYLSSIFDFSSTPPAVVSADGATFKANSTTSYLVYIENPHSKVDSFKFSVGLIDSNGLADTGLKIKGGQHMTIDANVENSKSHGILFEADSGYGIYYSTFNLRSRYNGGDGIKLNGLDSPNIRISSNVFFGQSSSNLGNGWSMNLAQNTFIGCEAEINNGYGFYIDTSYANDFFGGYSEGNHQNRAQGGTTDGTDDESFYITTNAARTKIVGGRHIGLVSGSTTGPGKIILPSNSIFDDFYINGTLATKLPGTLQTVGGIGVGASPISNAINISKGATYAFIYVNGTSCIKISDTDKSSHFTGPIFIGDTQAGIYAGEGSPEGVVTAAVGSLFMRTDGSTGTTLYIKESGSGNTGWVAK